MSDIGHYMFGVGAIIEHPTEKKILLSQRTSEFNFGTWEPVYGRLNQEEEPLDGLRREVFEETGLTDLKIKRVLRFWHIYRGPRQPEFETYGLTFICQATNTNVKISSEHSAYQWVDPNLAEDLIAVEGIKQDIRAYLDSKNHLTISNLEDKIHHIDI